MRQNILLRRRVIPQRVNLPNGTTLLSRHERVSRRNLPANMTINRTRTIRPRNRQVRKKRVTFANKAAQDRARRTVEKYRNHRRRKAQTGGNLLGNIAENIARLGANFDAKKLFTWGLSLSSKAITSEIGKKPDWWGHKTFSWALQTWNI